MIPTKRLGEGGVREDQRRDFGTGCLRQDSIQRHRGTGHRRSISRIQPRGDLARLDGR